MAISPVTVSFLTEVVRRTWGITATGVEPFAGEYSLTCRFHTNNGSVLVKSLSVPHDNVDHELRRLEQQLHIMQVSRDAGLPVARVIPRLSGGAVETTGDDNTVLVHVMDWTEGVRIDGVPMTVMLADSIGDTAGRFDAAVAHVAAPTHDTTHHWDARVMLESLDSVIPRLTHPAEIDVVVQARDLWASAMARHGIELPEQWVHHDMHDFNLLVGAHDTERITGLLDFGDTTYGLRVAEVAVAAAYAARASTHPREVFDAVVAAYERHTQLTPAEHAVLLPLACARLALNLATWSARADERTDTYARDRAAASLPALAALLPAAGE